MTFKHRRLWAALVVAMLMSLLPSALARAMTPDDYDPNNPGLLDNDHLYAESAFLFDMDTGEILLSKNSRVRMYPASTTKIMTCILAMESGIDLDQTVVIPREAANVPEGSSVLGVRQGDEITWRDLLGGLMLRSGNDAANAIAVLTSGSIDAFVARMNQRAAELNCEGTHFVNAHGYHDSDHYTTAQDLGRMALCAMRSEDFRQIVALPRQTLTVNRKGKVVTQDAENRNSLLVPESNYYYPDATGIKTGHHNKAGRCVVASAERDGIRLIGIVMNCASEEEQFADAKKLFEYGFTRYLPCTMEALLNRLWPEVNQVAIENAAEDDPDGGALMLNLGTITGGDASRMLQVDSEKAMNLALDDVRGGLTFQWNRALEAPVSAGEVMGTAAFFAPDGTRVTAQLLASRAIAAKPEPTATPEPTPVPAGNASRRKGAPVGLLILAALGTALAASLLVALKLRQDRRRRRRRAAARRRRAAQTRRTRRG